MYFAPWCPDSRRAQRVLQENNTPHLPIDIGKDNRAHRFVDSLTRRVRVPTILFPDGSLLIEPSNEALCQKIKSTSL
jgi:glutaredoxin